MALRSKMWKSLIDRHNKDEQKWLHSRKSHPCKFVSGKPNMQQYKLTDPCSHSTFHPLPHFPKRTWHYLELGLVAGLGRPHVFHQAAVKASVSLWGVADHQGSAGQLDQPGAQLQRLAVFLPPGEGHQIRVDLASHHLAAPYVRGGRRRLAGEPRHPWKTRRGCKRITRTIMLRMTLLKGPETYVAWTFIFSNRTKMTTNSSQVQSELGNNWIKLRSRFYL